MAGILPVFGPYVLPLERAVGRHFWLVEFHKYHYTDPVESLCC